MDCFEDDDDDEELLQAREKEYDCIICNTTGPSTESNPMGLVVLVESSSLVAHRRKSTERCPLPINDDDKVKVEQNVKFASEFNNRVELLTWKFGSTSWFLSHNTGWEGGVHVQSCGHHVHLICHDAYLKSLYTSQRPQNLNVERGEFFCPVCRQLANSVLPLSPQLNRPTPMIRTPTLPHLTLVIDLMSLIKENKRPSTTTKFYDAMGRAMESMTNCTQRIVKRHAPSVQSIFSFVISIARTNLEAEVIQRGGSLCAQNDVRYKPKRDCIVPLLHVLSLHVRLMVNDEWTFKYRISGDWPVWKSWAIVSGLELCNGPAGSGNPLVYVSEEDEIKVAQPDDEVIPYLLGDPCAMILKFILLAPLHLDQGKLFIE
jgi:E3 ubiquitin-protein ligase UBR3